MSEKKYVLRAGYKIFYYDPLCVVSAKSGRYAKILQVLDLHETDMDSPLVLDSGHILFRTNSVQVVEPFKMDHSMLIEEFHLVTSKIEPTEKTYAQKITAEYKKVTQGLKDTIGSSGINDLFDDKNADINSSDSDSDEQNKKNKKNDDDDDDDDIGDLSNKKNESNSSDYSNSDNDNELKISQITSQTYDSHLAEGDYVWFRKLEIDKLHIDIRDCLYKPALIIGWNRIQKKHIIRVFGSCNFTKNQFELIAVDEAKFLKFEDYTYKQLRVFALKEKKQKRRSISISFREMKERYRKLSFRHAYDEAFEKSEDKHFDYAIYMREYEESLVKKNKQNSPKSRKRKRMKEKRKSEFVISEDSSEGSDTIPLILLNKK